MNILHQFRRVANQPGVVFLYSGKNHEKEKKSILAYNPSQIFQTKNNKKSFEDLKEFKNKNLKKGILIGYFGYDLLYQTEKIEKTVEDNLQLPDMWFGYYENYIVNEHRIGDSVAYCQDDDFFKAISTRIPYPPIERKYTSGKVQSNFTEKQYSEAFEKIKKYIQSGDTYQINLSQRLETETDIPPWEIFLRLVEENPAEQSAYLDCGNFQIISTSPERFLKLENGVITTAPIKGTRPRFPNDPKKDETMRQELIESEKDAAELNMITDLLRNDLGRTAKTGSVHVTKNREIQKCPTVWHTFSEIQAELDKKYDAIDLVRACFPGGSITGCPKIRAMEIIDELEPTARSIYTGSIGYLTADGDMDLNIAIRTMIYKPGPKTAKVYFQVGGGIVADSECKAEYQETFDKATALIKALKTDKI